MKKILLLTLSILLLAPTGALARDFVPAYLSADSDFNKTVDKGAAIEILKRATDKDLSLDLKEEGDLSREAAAYLINAAFDLKGDKDIKLKDIDKSIYKAAIENLAKAGVIKGYADESFRPEEKILLSEFITMVNRAAKRPYLNSIDPRFEKTWAGKEITSAISSLFVEDGKLAKLSKNEERALGKLSARKLVMDKYGLKNEVSTIAALGWVDAVNLISSSAEIAGVPNNTHLPETALAKYTHIVEGKDILKDQIKADALIASEKDLKENPDLEKLAQIIKAINPKDVEEVIQVVGDYSSLAGNYDQGLENISKLYDQIDKYTKILQGKKIALLVLEEEDGRVIYSLPVEGSYADSILKEVGAINVGDKISAEAKTKQQERFAFKDVSLKDIMAEDPDALIFMPRNDKKERGALIKKVEDALRADYKDKDLVKNEKFGRIDHHWILPRSTQFVDGLVAIADILNKEIIVNLDLTKIKDGIYQGEASGYKPGLKTKTTVANNKITAIEIVSTNETEAIFNTAKDPIIKGIIDSQGFEVDNISGATMSSMGIKNSVKDGLSKGMK